jgi:uncharacterized membrane protein YtjA (UPF0391 family)
MVRLAIVFLIIALIAGLLGSGMIAGVALEAARIVFLVFLVLAVLSFLLGGFRRDPVDPI